MVVPKLKAGEQNPKSAWSQWMLRYNIPSNLPQQQSGSVQTCLNRCGWKATTGERRLGGSWNIVLILCLSPHHLPGSFGVFRMGQLPLELLSGLFALLQRAVDLVQGLLDAQRRQPSRGVLVPALFHQFDQSRERLRGTDQGEEESHGVRPQPAGHLPNQRTSGWE